MTKLLFQSIYKEKNVNKNHFKMLLSRKTLTGIFHLFTKYIPAYLYANSKNNSERIWLISERRDEARDNGYWLFRYIRENCPNQKVFYALDASSVDYEKISQLGNEINWGSFKHYVCYFLASSLISTGFDMCAPDLYASIFMKRVLPARGKKIFLQHGITKDFMHSATKEKMHASLLVCGGYPEYKFISDNFGYQDNEVQYLGFPRYDSLQCKEGCYQIIYMPTWRTWLSERNFKDTGYYKTICSFLQNRELQLLLRNSNMTLVYFLHPHIKKYKKYFEGISSVEIKVCNNDDYDLQELMKESELLITDYSSVYFDFAYMGKPVIYYQFDYEEYRKKQYQEGYFSYKRDGFGPIVHKEDALIESLKHYSDLGWKNEEPFISRGNNFFRYRDTDNCKRTYEAIMRIEDENE